MGGKSRKVGGVSRALIDRIKSGTGINLPASKHATGKAPAKDPFGLGRK